MKFWEKDYLQIQQSAMILWKEDFPNKTPL